MDASPDEFKRSIDVMLTDGESYIPRETVRWMAEEAVGHRVEPRQAMSPGTFLTAREREVLELVALGFSNSEIANILTISANTVRSHLHALCVKFNANGRMKMLAIARARCIPEALAVGVVSADRSSA
ncbi:hypothetical protein AYO38_10370 [bacterium SCGC AG-212-C10]|nr:hypothetical protein AYO38_10370 [bacterium SCGC AG-212-C10]